jgi:hypothetical protein
VLLTRICSLAESGGGARQSAFRLTSMRPPIGSLSSSFPCARSFLTREWFPHWVHIMVRYPFSSEKGLFAHVVGNPVRAYSSQFSLAIAHHYVMLMACRKTRIPWYTVLYIIFWMVYGPATGDWQKLIRT